MTAPTWSAALLTSETDRLEWKDSSLKHADAIVEAVCAMANDLGQTGAPGIVLVGVDKTGNVTGIDPNVTDDEAQQIISNKLRDIRLLPTPSVDVTVVHTEGDKRVLMLVVAPYDVPPVVTFNGVARVRVGSTTRKANDADLARMRERRPFAQQPFDMRPVRGATVDDLDLPSLRAQHEAARSDDDDEASFPALEPWLVTKDLGRFVDGAFAPTTTGILMRGKSPQDRFPGAYVDLVRYQGIDVDAPVAFRFLATGTLPDQLDALWKQLKEGIVAVPSTPSGMQESFVDEYPLEALQELVRNMVQHRAYDLTNAPSRVEWFDDRIELSNPGGPFGHASEGELGEHSDYRNPTLTRALVDLGYVQKLGRGVRRARSQLAKNGNPPLETETDGFTRVIIRKR